MIGSLFFTPGNTRELVGQKVGIAYGQLFIALFGFCASVWTYLLHLQLKTNSLSPLICDVNETINCSKIIGSSQGEFFGVPLGVWGGMFWLIVVGLLLFSKVSDVSNKYISFWRLVLATVGFAFALILIYISYFILKGICEVCTVVQICCILNFILALCYYIKTKKEIYFASKNDFLKLVLMVVTLSLLLLAVYLIFNSKIFDHYKERVIQYEEKQEDYNVLAPYHPVLDSDGGDYSMGDRDAPITIVQFTDFECPYCQLLHEKLYTLSKYIESGKVQIYFRNWPLSYHRYAHKLAIASRCAGRHGKFWEFADWSFDTAKKYARDQRQKVLLFSKVNLEKKAKEFGIRVGSFRKCLSDITVVEKIKKDGEDAQFLGARGTPFLLINGVPYKGNWTRPGVLEADIKKLLRE